MTAEPQEHALSLTEIELLLLANALNEICNGVDIEDFEFSARLGGNREEMRALLHRVGALYDEVVRPG